MKTRTIAVLIVLLSIGNLAFAQTSNSDEATVRALDDQTRTAALRRDTAALNRLWSDRLTVNAPDNTVVIGKRAVMDGYVRSGVINFSSFDREIEHMWVDGDFAFIMGLETVVPITNTPSSGLTSGQPTRRRVTNVWKKEAGTWRLYARHANVIPAR